MGRARGSAQSVPPTEAAPLHLRRRSTKIVQRPLAKQVRVSLASFRKLDNFLGDYRDSGVVSIHKPQGSARHFERYAYHALSLGIGFVAV
jgi:hypothetical protein